MIHAREGSARFLRKIPGGTADRDTWAVARVVAAICIDLGVRLPCPSIFSSFDVMAERNMFPAICDVLRVDGAGDAGEITAHAALGFKEPFFVHKLHATPRAERVRGPSIAAI